MEGDYEGTSPSIEGADCGAILLMLECRGILWPPQTYTRFRTLH